jgi:hypothetical protein
MVSHDAVAVNSVQLNALCLRRILTSLMCRLS